MLKEVLMPKLGQTVEEATIEAWHKQEGEAVRKGDVLLEITTDKATLEVESYITGTVKKLLYARGDTVPVNAVIAFVGDEEVSEELVRKALATASRAVAAPRAAAPAPAVRPAAAQAEVLAMVAPAIEPEAAEAPEGRLFASPRARRAAEEHRVPLQILRGSGPGSRIVEQDVLAYAKRAEGIRATPTARELARLRGVDIVKVKGGGEDGRIMRADVAAAPVRAAGGRRVPLTAMRRIVAHRMALSKATIPHFYLTIDVDMTETVQLRRALSNGDGAKVSFNDLLIRACTRAFEAVPEMNCAWSNDALIAHEAVNIGLAVGIEGGLVVPVVRGCEGKSLLEIAADTRGLIEKARNKRLTPDDYEGGHFTISNLGMFCVETVAPIINPGEAGILGVGRIAPRPVVVNDGFAIRQMTTLTLACDHRIVDGVIAARFLKVLKQSLESPKSLG